jgi:hypothetical protein
MEKLLAREQFEESITVEKEEAWKGSKKSGALKSVPVQSKWKAMAKIKKGTVHEEEPALAETKASTIANMAILGMMESLAGVLLQVQQEMKTMKEDKKAVTVTPEQLVKKEPAAEAYQKMASLEVLKEDPDYWYGLAHGKRGVSGVFPSWGEAAPLVVVGVSGASVKKFQNYWEAEAFVENYKKQKEMGAQINEILNGGTLWPEAGMDYLMSIPPGPNHPFKLLECQGPP